MINVKSILPLSSPRSYGGHIYLLALWKEKSHYSQSCDPPGQSASAKKDQINTLVEALMMLNKFKQAQSITTRLSLFQAGGARQRRRSCWCSSSPSCQSESHPSWNTAVVEKSLRSVEIDLYSSHRLSSKQEKYENKSNLKINYH